MKILLYMYFIFGIKWNYSNKTISDFDSSIPNEFKEYCGAEYKFFGKGFNYNLEKLVVIFRHGDRVPIRNWNKEWDKKKCIKCDFSENTIKNCLSKNCENGDLTINGFSQAESLGKFISNTYVKYLFPDGVDNKAISYRVTKIGRTHSTIMGVIKKITKLNILENIKKIPYNDPLLKIKNCGYMEQNIDTNTKVSDTTEILFEKIGIYDGKDLSYMADEIRCSMCNKLKVEQENRDNVLEKILKMSDSTWIKQMNKVNRNLTLKKIIFGRFAKELVEYLQSETTLSLVSAHDGSIGMLLSVLTSKIQKWPPYTSAIFIEVWCKSGKKFVRLIYNKERIDFDEYNEEFIPIEIFINYILSLCIDDNESNILCQSQTSQQVRNRLLTNDNIKPSKFSYFPF